mgnify:CR=1 FL=1|tara:strand:- start:5931 stop:7340 length:1410 start_codon:yes stop_codon:yes gene_type:complete
MSKKKILLLSDDIRIPSGVGTMSKKLVLGTLDKYDWVQIGGAVKHPEAGNIYDLSEQVQKEEGVEDAYLKIYPVDGYGNEEIMREVIALEGGVDGILHFTDPRFWGWLYNMEHEVRQTMPLMYLNIWDDLPFPHWNENAYESCDLLMAISKQTYNINKHVCVNKPRIEGVDLTYVPHGINEKEFYPLPATDEGLVEFKKNITSQSGVDPKFVLMFNSRNIQRKRVSDLVLAYTLFCETLPEEKAKECLLLLHTDPIDQHGTDLPALVKALCPFPVAFSANKLDPTQLNYLYNCADVVCSPSSAEGFGLTHMEGMMAGKPTISTVIGGLQDQMGFKVDGEELNIKHFSAEIPSNSTGKLSKHPGAWTYPLWPQLNLQGSPLTPYIYDSRSSIDQIQAGIKHWYDMPSEQRVVKGLAGREWAIESGFTTDAMCKTTSESIDTCFSNFKPRSKYTLINTKKATPAIKRGILL